jgi:multiple sugar transport system permease protein
MKKIWHRLLVVVILLWTLFPFYSLVVTSISASGSIGDLVPQKLDFQYYRQILAAGAEGIWPFLKNSVIICTLATAGVLLISIPAAYGFSRLRSRAGRTLYLGYFVLRMIPSLALLVPWYFILNSIGLIDTFTGLSFIYFIFQLPMGIWLMKGFFDPIPLELEEYAWIEGAGAFRTFRQIILPLASNGFAVTSVFVFIYCYIEFMYASIFTRSNTVTLPPYIASFSTPWEIRFQLMLAAALVSTLPMVLLFVFVQRYMVKGITGGALKY